MGVCVLVGSMTAENCAELAHQPDVDGFIVEPCAAPNAATAEIFGQRRRKTAARLKMRPSPKDSQ